MSDQVIEIGDTVYIGEGKIHWVVEWISLANTLGWVRVRLASGMTDRICYAWLHRLRLHSKKEPS